MTMTIRPVSTIEFIGLSETNTIGYYRAEAEAMTRLLPPLLLVSNAGPASPPLIDEHVPVVSRRDSSGYCHAHAEFSMSTSLPATRWVRVNHPGK
jgi:hypothetical protein